MLTSKNSLLSATKPAQIIIYYMSVCFVFSERRLSLTLEYENYGSVITSDRMIHVSAFTIDNQDTDYHKAEKTIVLDEPDIEIKVW